MFKKRLFRFSLLLNVFFYLGTTAALYWHQKQSLKNDVSQIYRKQTVLFEQELNQHKEFYQNWLNHAKDLPKNSRDLDLFLRMNSIQYLGYFSDQGLTPLGPNKKPPPFPDYILRANNGSLFHRNKQELFFTYTYMVPVTGPTYVVTHSENMVRFIQRLSMIGGYVVVLEKMDQDPVTVLFSNMPPKLTESFAKNYTRLDQNEATAEFSFSEDDFYVLPIGLFRNDQFKQALFVIFNRSLFFFPLSMSVAVLMLALFCASSLLLFIGYLRSKE